MKCEYCGYVDYSIAYLTNPPKYKCEKYGCIVGINDKCRWGKNAEKQEKEQKAQQSIQQAGTAVQPECKGKHDMAIFSIGRSTSPAIWIRSEKDN